MHWLMVVSVDIVRVTKAAIGIGFRRGCTLTETDWKSACAILVTGCLCARGDRSTLWGQVSAVDQLCLESE